MMMEKSAYDVLVWALSPAMNTVPANSQRITGG